MAIDTTNQYDNLLELQEGSTCYIVVTCACVSVIQTGVDILWRKKRFHLFVE